MILTLIRFLVLALLVYMLLINANKKEWGQVAVFGFLLLLVVTV